MTLIQIVADGGSLNNQSPDRKGYGSFVVLKDNVRSKISFDVNGELKVVDTVKVDFGNQTNNYCEHGIVAMALGYIREVFERAGRTFPIEILTDSALVVGQMKGTSEIKSDNLKDVALSNMASLASMPDVTITWVDNKYVKSILGH
jgi:ribonuclease HI